MKFDKGDKIPEFELIDHNDQKVSLDKFSDKNVLLSFHPLAWTRVCRLQMEALEEHYQEFLDNNTIPLGISVDPVPSKKAWAEDLDLENLRLLSDFWKHGDFADKLGIFLDNKGISGRVNILVNERGEIIWSKVYDIHEEPDIAEVLKIVKENA